MDASEYAEQPSRCNECGKEFFTHTNKAGIKVSKWTSLWGHRASCEMCSGKQRYYALQKLKGENPEKFNYFCNSRRRKDEW